LTAWASTFLHYRGLGPLNVDPYDSRLIRPRDVRTFLDNEDWEGYYHELPNGEPRPSPSPAQRQVNVKMHMRIVKGSVSAEMSSE
jgi:hypothetical protein